MSRFTRTLDQAISLLDAEFMGKNAKKHVGKHANELGLAPQEYKGRAKQLSESPIGGNIIGYRRPDGSEVRVNKQTREYVAFRGNKAITYYKLSEGQYQRALKGAY